MRQARMGSETVPLLVVRAAGSSLGDVIAIGRVGRGVACGPGCGLGVVWGCEAGCGPACGAAGCTRAMPMPRLGERINVFSGGSDGRGPRTGMSGEVIVSNGSTSVLSGSEDGGGAPGPAEMSVRSELEGGALPDAARRETSRSVGAPRSTRGVTGADAGSCGMFDHARPEGGGGATTSDGR